MDRHLFHLSTARYVFGITLFCIIFVKLNWNCRVPKTNTKLVSVALLGKKTILIFLDPR